MNTKDRIVGIKYSPPGLRVYNLSGENWGGETTADRRMTQVAAQYMAMHGWNQPGQVCCVVGCNRSYDNRRLSAAHVYRMDKNKMWKCYFVMVCQHHNSAHRYSTSSDCYEIIQGTPMLKVYKRGMGSFLAGVFN